jgi:DNA invertase Pin-like site-specific DNA recombinase
MYQKRGVSNVSIGVGLERVFNCRVVLYARVSTKDKGQDTENQLRNLRQFASSQGWNIVQEYVDRATGKHSDREQFQKMCLLLPLGASSTCCCYGA